jgi:CubicO group peptidase (beta-lactamase class C family)
MEELKMKLCKAIPASAVLAADTLGIHLPRLNVLDAYCQRMVDEKKHAFIGFRILRHGQLIFSGEYGTQSHNGPPLRTDAIYPIASATKPFLATCAAILQEDGQLDFYDQLQKHRPEFTGKDKDEVILWMLLCHTTGMDDGAVDEYWKQLHGGASPDEIGWDIYNCARFEAPLAAKPGTKFSYFSYGYNIIQQLIEKATGETLEQFAKRKIFDPLGMTDTHWVLPEEKRERFVTRDPSFKGGEWISSEHMMTSTAASGGLKSTLDDMAKFGQMWLQWGTVNGQRVMSPASVRTMTRNHNEGVPPSDWFGRQLGANWGLGWDLKGYKTDDHGFLRSPSSYNHGGFGGACILLDPEYDLVFSGYFCEQAETSQNDDFGPAFNILYSAFD